MARVFITGSTDGLGRAAAKPLIDEGHEVALHARSRERASAVDDLASRSAGVVVGDLRSAVETRHVADQVNAIGRMDAVIHNAGTYSMAGRSPTEEAHPTILAVNTLAPYILTALIERPRRLVYSVAACIVAAPARCATSTGSSGAGTPARRIQTASCTSPRSPPRLRGAGRMF